MKYLILLLAPLFLFASQDRLSNSEHNSIHNYNNRPIVKMNKNQKMHRLHKVNEKEVAKITQDVTGEEFSDMKLLHSGNILKYYIKTKNYTLEVNALDGKIISKTKR